MKSDFILRLGLRFVPPRSLSVVAIVFLSVAFLGSFSCHRTAPSTSRDDPATVEKEFDLSYDKANFPWYSSEEKNIVFLREPVEKKKVRTRDFSLNENNNVEEGLWGKFFVLWLPVAFFIVVLIFLTLYAAKQYRMQQTRRRLREEELQHRRRRIETLTDEARERYDDLEKASEEALLSGDLRSCLIFYFSWLLVEMDKRDVIRLDKGKTNLDYWRELAPVPRLREPYHSVMTDFERVYYGGLAISREDFDKVWRLRETFKQLMFEEDEQKARRLREREEALRHANLKKWQGPTSMSVALCILGSALLTTGCRQDTWSDSFADPLSSSSRDSLNDVSLFTQYCVRQNPGRVRQLNPWRMNQDGDFDKCDTIVWFCSKSRYGHGVWNLTSPCDTGEFTSDSDDAQARLNAWKACLERYASATKEDWTRFCVPYSNAAFYRSALTAEFLGESPDELAEDSGWQKIRNWLQGKAGRKCIVVLSDQNSARDYWRDASEYVERAYDEPLKSKYMKECERRVDGTDKGSTSRNYLYDDLAISGYHSLPDAFNDKTKTELQKRARNARKLLVLLPLLGDVSSPQEVLTRINTMEDFLFGHTERSLEQLVELENVLEATRRLALGIEEQVDSRVEEEDDSASVDEEFVFDDNAPEKDHVSDYWQNSLRTFFPLEGYFVIEDFQRNGLELGDDFEHDSPLYRPELWFRQQFIEWSNDDLPHEEAFTGEPSWLKGLPEKAPCREMFKLIPAEGTETLLSLGDAPLVCRRQVGDGTLVLVNSTSFLSNYGLIDPTNRIIANRLTREFNPEGKIGFLTAPDFNYNAVISGVKTKYVRKRPDGRFTLTKFSAFTVFVWHLAALTIFAGFSAWPIFGRTRRAVRDKTSDFGMHVDATASLLKNADSVSWAHEQIDACRKYRKRDGLLRGANDWDSETER